MILATPPSPTGTPVIPPKAVPYVQALASVLNVVGAEFGLPGAWTPERIFMVSASVLSVLLGGALPGLRK